MQYPSTSRRAPRTAADQPRTWPARLIRKIRDDTKHRQACYMGSGRRWRVDAQR